MPCDVLLPIRFPNGAMVKAGVNIRPWVKECLEELSREFELMVFTASHECYANVIIDHIDPKRLITHRFFRDSCWRSEEGFYVKDLRVIDRDLRNVLLIDNVSQCLLRPPTATASNSTTACPSSPSTTTRQISNSSPSSPT